jgi:hypothetical protein
MFGEVQGVKGIDFGIEVPSFGLKEYYRKNIRVVR